jgi:hypothetical protein
LNLLLFLLISLFACFYQGMTGFGAALIVAPLSLLFLDKFTVVLSITVTNLIMDTFLCRSIKQQLGRAALCAGCTKDPLSQPQNRFLWITISPCPINPAFRTRFIEATFSGGISFLRARYICFSHTCSRAPWIPLFQVL